jgi:hypothetical protein
MELADVVSVWGVKIVEHVRELIGLWAFSLRFCFPVCSVSAGGRLPVELAGVALPVTRHLILQAQLARNMTVHPLFPPDQFVSAESGRRCTEPTGKAPGPRVRRGYGRMTVPGRERAGAAILDRRMFCMLCDPSLRDLQTHGFDCPSTWLGLVQRLAGSCCLLARWRVYIAEDEPAVDLLGGTEPLVSRSNDTCISAAPGWLMSMCRCPSGTWRAACTVCILPICVCSPARWHQRPRADYSCTHPMGVCQHAGKRGGNTSWSRPGTNSSSSPPVCILVDNIRTGDRRART